MTTLDNSYCVPNTKEDWALFGYDSIPKFAVDGVRYFYAINDGRDGDFNYSCEMGAFGGNFGIIFDWLTNEIPATQFLDLLHDRIAQWRLEEVGFLTPFDAPIYRLLTPNHIIHVETRAESGGPFNPNDIVRVDGGETSITTFTDLLTLIKFLTPPTK